MLNSGEIEYSQSNKSYQSEPASEKQECLNLISKNRMNESNNPYGSLPTSDLDEEYLSPISSFRSRNDVISSLIVASCVLIGDMARGILFPTLWLFVQSLGGDKFMQGIAVSAFSIGRIISSPIFGYWSEIYGYKYVLILCNIIIMIGCYSYTLSESLPSIIFSQFLIGFGAGSLGVTRSYVAEKTHKSERTLYMAYITAVQYGGFTVTPIVGALISSFGQTHNSVSFSLIINQYSLPALFLAFFSFCCIVLLIIFFTDVPRNPINIITTASETEMIPTTKTNTRTPVEENNNNNNNNNNNDNNNSLSSESYRMAIGGCLLNITTKGTIGVFETVGLIFVTKNYNWSGVTAGLTISICGSVGVLFLISFSFLLLFAKDVDLVLYGMMAMTLSCLMMVRMFFSAIPQWEYFSAIIMMYSIGYPIGHTALLGIFSKILAKGPQGKLLGYFGSAGSLARVVFPLLAGYLTEYFGDNFIFIIMAILLFVSCIVFFFNKKAIESVVE